MTSHLSPTRPKVLEGVVAPGGGKRLGALLLDGLFTTLVQGVVVALAWGGIIRQLLAGAQPQEVDATLMPVPGLVSLAVTVLYVLMVWLRGLTPGHLVLGMRMVSCDTGASPKGRGLVWYVLAGLLGGVSMGIVTLVIVLRPDEQGRNWYDRTAGVVVVDLRAGTDPLSRAGAQAPETAPPARLRDPDEELGATMAAPQQSAFGAGGGLGGPAQTTRLPSGDLPLFAPPPVSAPVPQPPAAAPQPASAGPGPGEIIRSVPWEGLGRLQVSPPPAAPAVAAVPQAHPAQEPALEVDERTHLGAHRPEVLLRFDTGQKAIVDSVRTVLGRNPEGRGQWAQAAVLVVDDPERSVSKTHLGLQRVDKELWVQDFGSTNGTGIVLPDGSETPVQGPQAVQLPQGAAIRVGERLISVER